MLTAEAALQILKRPLRIRDRWSICTWWHGGYFATLGHSADLIEGGAKPRRLEGEIIARSFETEFSRPHVSKRPVEWLRDTGIRLHPEASFVRKNTRSRR